MLSLLNTIIWFIIYFTFFHILFLKILFVSNNRYLIFIAILTAILYFFLAKVNYKYSSHKNMVIIWNLLLASAGSIGYIAVILILNRLTNTPDLTGKMLFIIVNVIISFVTALLAIFFSTKPKKIKVI